MTDDFASELRKVLADERARSELALKAYEQLKGAGKLGSHRILSYRCAHRCLLLDVLRTPHGLLLAFPRYRLSDTENGQTSPSAREKRTDGNGRWKPRATFADGFDVGLNCDHLRNKVLPADRLEEDVRAGRAEVIWRDHPAAP